MKTKQTIKLKESQLRNIISESIKRILNESQPENNINITREEWYPDGWEKITRKDGKVIYRDEDGYEYAKDEQGYFEPLLNFSKEQDTSSDDTGIDPETALNSKKVFYAKKQQSNGYFPIYKYVWDDNRKEWEEFDEKESNGKRFWRSYGFPKANGVSNYEWLKYKFEHNPYKLGFDEMFDNRHFNLQ
jgi:hypothetical protein